MRDKGIRALERANMAKRGEKRRREQRKQTVVVERYGTRYNTSSDTRQ